jgi:ADP-ribose pyrophosphatase YjhB (NUDIX family)
MANITHPPSPLVSVDVVPLAVDAFGRVSVVLSRRLFSPYKGRFALPGVLVLAGERLAQAAGRALLTKSGIDTTAVRFTHITQPYDNPARDERGPTVSIAYLAVVEPGPAKASTNRLVAVDGYDPTGLPFDHASILTDGLAWAALNLWAGQGELARALLGDRFTGVQAATLISGLDPTFNTTNTPRLLRTRTCLRRSTEPVKPAQRGRPPITWEFQAEA